MFLSMSTPEFVNIVRPDTMYEDWTYDLLETGSGSGNDETLDNIGIYENRV